MVVIIGKMRGDDEARRKWFRREILPLEKELRAHARQFCRNGEREPEDLVHETFARAIAYEGWRSIDNPTAFAHRVLKNTAIDALRRAKIVNIQSMANLDDLGLVDDAPDPEAIALSRDALRRLRSVVAGLSPQVRRVFTLKKVYGMTTAEIADELGLSVSTIEKHLTRALRICSEQIARDVDRNEPIKQGPPWRKRRVREEKP